MSEAIDPAEASLRMAAGSIYVDVRSEAEFALGHPAGARNVPIGIPPSPEADAGFVKDIQMYFAPDDSLIIGCASGRRSARAVLLLTRAGFTNLADQTEGYDGRRDAFGSRTVPGWSGSSLPRETGPDQRRAPRS